MQGLRQAKQLERLGLYIDKPSKATLKLLASLPCLRHLWLASTDYDRTCWPSRPLLNPAVERAVRKALPQLLSVSVDFWTGATEQGEVAGFWGACPPTGLLALFSGSPLLIRAGIYDLLSAFPYLRKLMCPFPALCPKQSVVSNLQDITVNQPSRSSLFSSADGGEAE